MKSNNSKRILVIDDEPKIRDIICDILEHEGYIVNTAADGTIGLQRAEEAYFDLVILDVVMPGIDGMSVLQQLIQQIPGLPVIMISAHGDIPLAVKATHMGAIDFIEKPIDINNLLTCIEKHLIEAEAERRSVESAERSLDRYGFIAVSSCMEKVLTLIDQAANSDIRILVTGDTGTGKELVAEAIHKLSRRATNRFVRVNCAAIPENLIESELFGHMKGAFTGAFAGRIGKFEVAHQGTLFLDEIADMSPNTQAKVLRVLEDGEVQPLGGTTPRRVDVRLIAATNKNLEQMVSEGTFREDLYYRINVVAIHLPPLSVRKEDISHLAIYYLRCFAGEYNMRERRISPLTLDALKLQSWPGNIRELRNVMEKLVVMTDSEVIEPRHIRMIDANVSWPAANAVNRTLHAARDQFEADYIGTVLAECRGNISRTAIILGIDRTTLYRKMQQLGIN